MGKTTSVYSVSVFLKDKFNSVLAVPPEIDLRNVMTWLQENIPAKSVKITPILFDGREVTDDSVFSSWQETLYLLSNPVNAKHLLASIQSAKVSEIMERVLIEE